MRVRLLFATLIALAGIAVVGSGCGASGPAPVAQLLPEPTATPVDRLLYVDHYGTFYEYRLPLTQGSKPFRVLKEWAKLPVPPMITADQYGNVALASTTELRLFKAPIVSFDRSRAKAQITLTPAMTGVGSFGADLSDIEYDPNENLWLFNNLGGLGGITQLRPPITQSSVASAIIIFGAPGTKTAGFTTVVQGRFDINATLYVYASASNTSRLFKVAFPYAKPPGTTGLDLAQAEFVDSSQWPSSARTTPSLMLGEYTGDLRTPKPGAPPSPPVTVAAQFVEPLMPVQGSLPNEHINTNLGAVAADPYRYTFYGLSALDGALEAYQLPMQTNAKPTVSLKCLAGLDNCGKTEHLFLAP